MNIRHIVTSQKGFWHGVHLFVFYLSTTFSLLLIFIMLRAQKWIKMDDLDLGRYFLNGTSPASKLFLIIMTIFFILNTFYLINKKD